MLEIFLISVLSLLLTEYGFQTRKAAFDRFVSAVRWRRVFARILIWSTYFGIYLVKLGRGWRKILVLVVIGFLIGEVIAFLLRRSIQNDLRNRYPLSRPLSHLVPIALCALPALVWGYSFYRLTGTPLNSHTLLPLKVLKFVVGLVGMFSWGTMVTVSLIGMVRGEHITDEIGPHLGAGEVIGVLERLLSYILVLSGGLAVIGFTIAAKAAARYPQFKNPSFAEYFLIGTLSSVGLAIVTGLLLSLA